MSRRTPILRTAIAGLALAALALAGCASSGSSSDGDTAADEGYVTPGTLTVATGDIAYYPYVIDDDPSSGEGFEAAVAYAIADKLGFAHDDVEWVRTSFEAAIAPGPKNFDFNIQQYTITDERKQAVDFSSPYYSASQAVVALKGGPADGVDTIEGLKGLTIGAMAGSTSAQTLEEVIAPDVEPATVRLERGRHGSAQRQPDRRVRDRPAHRLPRDRDLHRELLHRGRAARGRHPRRVGRRALEGLAAHRARQRCSRRAARRRHPRRRSPTSGSVPARASPF